MDLRWLATVFSGRMRSPCVDRVPLRSHLLSFAKICVDIPLGRLPFSNTFLKSFFHNFVDRVFQSTKFCMEMLCPLGLPKVFLVFL